MKTIILEYDDEWGEPGFGDPNDSNGAWVCERWLKEYFGSSIDRKDRIKLSVSNEPFEGCSKIDGISQYDAYIDGVDTPIAEELLCWYTELDDSYDAEMELKDVTLYFSVKKVA